MAFIKSHTLKNGLTAPQAYHVIYKVDAHKRPVDDIDPYGARPSNLPDHMWKAGLYGRIALAIYADKNARLNGKSPIAVVSTYPTETPNNTFDGERLEMSEFKLKFTVDLNSDKDLMAQAYDHLANLDEYKDAVRD